MEESAKEITAPADKADKSIIEVVKEKSTEAEPKDVAPVIEGSNWFMINILWVLLLKNRKKHIR